uniref:Uncharacterized protein n=1 Tax=Oryza barthii TaxID=65489 RepID=A0A0D3HB05_9ORYZ
MRPNQSYHQVLDSDSDDEIWRLPRVVGFIDDPNSILVRTELGVFMVDILSNEYEQLSHRINFTTVYPYVSFYTTVGKTNFNEPMLIDNGNNGEDEEQTNVSVTSSVQVHCCVIAWHGASSLAVIVILGQDDC